MPPTQKAITLPSHSTIQKPLITKKKWKQQLALGQRHWTSEISQSNVQLQVNIKAFEKQARKDEEATQVWVQVKATVKTVKHPDSAMMWGSFSGSKGHGLYDSPSSSTNSYNHVLEKKMLSHFEINKCQYFMHDSVPYHKF